MGCTVLVQYQVFVPMEPLVRGVHITGGSRLVVDRRVKSPNHWTVPLVPLKLIAGGFTRQAERNIGASFGSWRVITDAKSAAKAAMIAP